MAMLRLVSITKPLAMNSPILTRQTTENFSSLGNHDLSRRRFLGVGTAALAAMGVVVPALAAERSRTDPGPANPPLDAQNPDSTWPPATDSKSLVENFKYPFSFANKRAYEGGWSRE